MDSVHLDTDSVRLFIAVIVLLIYTAAAVNGGNKRTRGKLEALAVAQTDNHAKQVDLLTATCSTLFDHLRTEIREGNNAIIEQNREAVSRANALVLRAVAETTSEITANQERLHALISVDVAATHNSVRSSSGTVIMGIEQLKMMSLDDTAAVHANTEKTQEVIIRAVGSAEVSTSKNISLAMENVKATIREHTVALGTNLDQSRAMILRRTDSADFLSAVENAGFLADKLAETQVAVLEAIGGAERSVDESISGAVLEMKDSTLAQVSAVSERLYERISVGLADVHGKIHGAATRIGAELDHVRKSVSDEGAQLSAKVDQAAEVMFQTVGGAEVSFEAAVLRASDHVKSTLLAQLSSVGENIDQFRDLIIRRTESADYLASLENIKEVRKSVSQLEVEMDAITEFIKIAMVNNLVNDMREIVRQ